MAVLFPFANVGRISPIITHCADYVELFMRTYIVASAKNSFDTQSTELTQMSAKVVLLDRVLARYGPETKEARELLRSSVARVLDQMWSKHGTSSH